MLVEYIHQQYGDMSEEWFWLFHVSLSKFRTAFISVGGCIIYINGAYSFGILILTIICIVSCLAGCVM